VSIADSNKWKKAGIPGGVENKFSNGKMSNGKWEDE
jgi:hypothetical protein